MLVTVEKVGGHYHWRVGFTRADGTPVVLCWGHSDTWIAAQAKARWERYRYLRLLRNL